MRSTPIASRLIVRGLEGGAGAGEWVKYHTARRSAVAAVRPADGVLVREGELTEVPAKNCFGLGGKALNLMLFRPVPVWNFVALPISTPNAWMARMCWG